MKSSLPALGKRMAMSTLLLFCIAVFQSNAQSVLNVGSGQTYSTIQDAIDAASGSQTDTVNIVTSPITEVGITVNKNIVIRGQGMNSTIVRGAASAGVASNRIMNIVAGYTVHIMNLTLQNGYSPVGADQGGVGGTGGDGVNGGGIYNSGTLTLTYVKLANNYCGKGGQGTAGSIPAIGSPVLSTAGGAGGNGGAVYNAGTLIARGCVFIGNRGGLGGVGGVPVSGYIGGTLPGSLNGGAGPVGGNGGQGGHGAAIYNVGNLKLIETTISGNSCGNGAVGSGGGNGGDGLISSKAAVKSGNGGTGGAGGAGGNGGSGTIYNAGTIDTIINCTLYGNAAGNGGNGGLGGYGGAGMKGADSTQSPVLGPTFYGGTGGDGGTGGLGGNAGNCGNGGAIYNATGHVVNFMINTTLTQNSAGFTSGIGGDGGSCGMFGFAGSATPAPQGVSGQPGQVGTNGSGGNGGNGGTGGGIYTFSDLFSCKNDILAGNSFATAGAGGAPGSMIMGNSGISGTAGVAGQSPDVQGNFGGPSYTIVGKKDGSNFVNGVSNNVCGTIASPVDAQLGPLADNGGPTQTVIISASSPARDAGNATSAPAKDQRGVSRFGVLDIGSYEYQLPSISMADDGTINEGAENGELITVTVSEDVFNASINASGFTVNNLPAGVSKGAVTRTGAHTATIALSGNRTTDYDVDITNVSVVVIHTELAGLTSGSMTVSTGVTLHAFVESCTISPGVGLVENTLNNDTIELTLVQDNFLDATLVAANFTLSHMPAGVTIANALYVNATHAHLILNFTGTDFDVDSTGVKVTVNENELYGVANLISNAITIHAVVESGISENDGNGAIEIYPNPATNALHLVLPDVTEAVQVVVFDVKGQQWLSTTVQMQGEQGVVDISTLSPGLYLIQIQSAGQRISRRFCVQ